jgi:hypothetical protein
VWKFREQKDAYTGLTRYKMKGLPIDMDHVLELHVARDAFDRVQSTGVGRRKKKAVAKDHLTRLLNQPSNLNATTSDINQIKFRGVYGFQRDWLGPLLGGSQLPVEAVEPQNNSLRSKRNRTFL